MHVAGQHGGHARYARFPLDRAMTAPGPTDQAPPTDEPAAEQRAAEQRPGEQRADDSADELAAAHVQARQQAEAGDLTGARTVKAFL